MPVALGGRDLVARQTCPVLCSLSQHGDGPQDGAAGRRGRPTASAPAVLARAADPWSGCIGRHMKGTQFAAFATEVLQRGAAAVLPQHLSDRWLDALLEEADLFAPAETASEEGDRRDDGCAGLLGAVLVVLMAQRGHPDTLEVAASTLMSHMHCYILALAAERVSRDTEIWVEPPTLVNLFDEARAVHARRRSVEGA
jgi:hypothetical protein